MFSIINLGQVALPASYVVPQLLGSPSIRHNVRARPNRKSACSSTLSPETLQHVMCQLAKSSDITEVQRLFTPQLLKQIAPHNIRQQARFCRTASLHKASPWLESHISSDSFAENKKRVADREGQKEVSWLLGRSNYFNNSPLLNSWHVTTPELPIGVREFKTRAALEREAERLNVKKEPKEEKKQIPMSNYLKYFIYAFLLVMLYNSIPESVSIRRNTEHGPVDSDVTFEDVKGAEECKTDLQEIVEFLRNPHRFTNLGAELPKGVLLVGPPGTGKTLLARAVAGEAGVPFFRASGSEFDEMLVGLGARRVRNLFLKAKKMAPCVIFIDEIDSVGGKRTSSSLHPYANQTVNQLLTEMDGFHQNSGVIVLGATNRRSSLDPAILRPGRFDCEINVPVPDLKGRKELLEHYLSKITAADNVNLDVLGRGTTGFTGADIKNLVNQAALRAATDDEDEVTMKYLEIARDKILMGPEAKSRIPDAETNKITAFHEGGHAIVSYFTKHSQSLHKVTIIPRGPSLGHTAYIPEKEQYHMSYVQMLASLDSLMGGRAAEEIIFGTEHITAGASSDLRKATTIAERMVREFGMSDKVGLRVYDENPESIKPDSFASSTIATIDTEVTRILQESYERAKAILMKKSKQHHELANALLQYETLDADDVKSILDPKPNKGLKWGNRGGD